MNYQGQFYDTEDEFAGLYPSLIFCCNLNSRNSLADSSEVNSLDALNPEVPILPKRSATALPSIDPSQNLCSFSFLSSYRPVLGDVLGEKVVTSIKKRNRRNCSSTPSIVF